jgi:formate--tetrahydrofolate ligase
MVVSEGWAKGGLGTMDLAQAVVDSIESGKNSYKPLFEATLPVKDKIETIAREIYGSDGVAYSNKAKTALNTLEKMGWQQLAVCMAKTQKSFSDDESLRNRPKDFTITVRDFEFATGAGFVIPILGDMMRMPGLPAIPASEGMFIDEDGEISGLA